MSKEAAPGSDKGGSGGAQEICGIVVVRDRRECMPAPKILEFSWLFRFWSRRHHDVHEAICR